MKTNIIIGSGLIILYIAKSQRHRDTEILSIGVIILLYIESDVQKLLTYIVPNGGWSSETYVKNNINRIERISKKHDETGVLYFGDYDPTGLRMVRNLERDLKKLDIGFEHVAITKEQIARYGLENLTNPDPTVMAKLRRDSNANAFRAQNNGRLFQIEVDALNALRPQDFVTLLEDSVDDHFIPEVYDEVMADPQYSSTSIRRLVRKSIKKFSDYEKAYKDGMKEESKKSKK